MDVELRRLERLGNFDRWLRLAIKCQLWTTTDDFIGPIQLKYAKCAVDECDNKLRWSNCSYCVEHHLSEEYCEFNYGYLTDTFDIEFSGIAQDYPCISRSKDGNR